MKKINSLDKYFRCFFVLLVCALTLTSTAAFAETETGGYLDWIACDIEEIAYNLRTVVYVIAALGMMGIAVTAFVGKFRWGWVFSWAFAVFLLGAVEALINLIFGETVGCDWGAGAEAEKAIVDNIFGGGSPSGGGTPSGGYGAVMQ